MEGKNYKYSKEEKEYLQDLINQKKSMTFTEIAFLFNEKFNLNKNDRNMMFLMYEIGINLKKSLCGHDFIKISDVAEKYNVSYNTIKRIYKQNNIRLYKKGKYKLINIDDIHKIENKIKDVLDYKQIKPSKTNKNKTDKVKIEYICKKLFLNDKTVRDYAKKGLFKYETLRKMYVLEKQEADKFIDYFKYIYNHCITRKELSGMLFYHENTISRIIKKYDIPIIMFANKLYIDKKYIKNIKEYLNK